MPRDWGDLAATLVSNEYQAKPGDRFYGATEPLEPKSCRCESPWTEHDADDGEVRCWKCGRLQAGTTDN